MLTPNPRVARPVELAGRQVLVVGAGVSGVAAAKLAAIGGAQVAVVDEKPLGELSEDAKALAGMGVMVLGETTSLGGAPSPDLAVVSPGVPPTAPIMEELRERGVEVVGEMELAWQYCPARVAAVTGTNGKGTTCRLMAGMLEAAGLPVALAGNIGRPLAACLFELTAEHVVVLEVSSFQLMTTRAFAPQVAAVLNLTPDHLDWHRDLEEYARAKEQILARQWPTDLAVIVIDDPGAAAMEEAVTGRLARVSVEREAEVEWRKGEIVVRLPGKEERRIGAAAIEDWGPYHRLDAMVAAAGALEMGADEAAIERALGEYQNPEHLMTEVADVDGVRYVDDSKATNVAAAIADLEHLARKGPVVVISGGKDKGTDLWAWAEEMTRKAKAVVLIGETAGKLAGMVGGKPERARDMTEAVRMAKAKAAAGDAVALIPAASSFDMYANYAERGKAFKQAVEKAKS
jgi:UDP-N-acetylmuramoylalanine--D-glutamate ligase